MLQEQPKEKEAPQVSGSKPWQAQVLLRSKDKMQDYRYSTVSSVGASPSTLVSDKLHHLTFCVTEPFSCLKETEIISTSKFVWVFLDFM